MGCETLDTRNLYLRRCLVLRPMHPHRIHAFVETHIGRDREHALAQRHASYKAWSRQDLTRGAHGNVAPVSYYEAHDMEPRSAGCTVFMHPAANITMPHALVVKPQDGTLLWGGLPFCRASTPGTWLISRAVWMRRSSRICRWGAEAMVGKSMHV